MNLFYPSPMISSPGGFPLHPWLPAWMMSQYYPPSMVVPTTPLPPPPPLSPLSPTGLPSSALSPNESSTHYGGNVYPEPFSHAQEQQWLEVCSELGGVGVRAKTHLPAGYYVAHMRTKTHVQGVLSDEFAVKINDHCFRQGMSLAQYEALYPDASHIKNYVQLVMEPQGGEEPRVPTVGKGPFDVRRLNERYPEAGFANCRLQSTPYGLLVQVTAEVPPGTSLSLYYGKQSWYEGRPFRFNPAGDSTTTTTTTQPSTTTTASTTAAAAATTNS